MIAGEGATSVGGALVALDEAGGLEPVDPARHAAAAEQHVCPRARSSEAGGLRRRRELDQDVEIREGQLPVRLQVRLEAADDRGVRLQERPPRLETGIRAGET